MLEKEAIKKQIKDAFGDVPFPSHCGIKAAIAMDDWISDPDILREITAKKDVKGKWWEIPYEEFKYCSLAFCYLDAKGTEFYLPAYMTIVLDCMQRKDYNTLISWLKPDIDEEDSELLEYFCEQFANIGIDRKKSCVNVLKYIQNHADKADYCSKQEIDAILSHEFWKIEC